jgi:hypothetical protein
VRLRGSGSARNIRFGASCSPLVEGKVVLPNLANDGTITWDPSLNGVLTSPGPNMLTVNGVTLNVDAPALSQLDSSFTLDGVSFSTAQDSPTDS